MFQVGGESSKRGIEARAGEEENGRGRSMIPKCGVPQGCYGLTLHRYQFTIGTGSVRSASVEQSNLV